MKHDGENIRRAEERHRARTLAHQAVVNGLCGLEARHRVREKFKRRPNIHSNRVHESTSVAGVRRWKLARFKLYRRSEKLQPPCSVAAERQVCRGVELEKDVSSMLHD